MQTLEQIKKQIESLTKDKSIFAQKEINFLPDLLGENESILSVARGVWKRNILQGDFCIALCTNKRILILYKTSSHKEMPLKDISSIAQKIGFLTGEIILASSAGSICVNNIVKSVVKPFIDAVNKAKENADNKADAAQNDTVTQLERLVKLKEEGNLTEAEFKKQKKVILNNS